METNKIEKMIDETIEFYEENGGLDIEFIRDGYKKSNGYDSFRDYFISCIEDWSLVSKEVAKGVANHYNVY